MTFTKIRKDAKTLLAGTMAAVMMTGPILPVLGHGNKTAFAEDAAYGQWALTAIYDAGERVLHNGVVFEAQWWTQNQEPGINNHGSWMEIQESDFGFPIWTASRVFEAGDVVYHEGELFIAQWWTRNSNPNRSNGGWETYIPSNISGDFESGEICLGINDKMIRTLEKYLKVDEGIFQFDSIPFSVFSEFGYENVRSLIDGVEIWNELAQSEMITIGDDFEIEESYTSVIPLNLNSLNSNSLSRTSHWWGTRWHFNRNGANRQILAFDRYRNDRVLATALMSAVFKVPGAVIGAVAVWEMNQKATAFRQRLAEPGSIGVEYDAHLLTPTWVTRARR